MTDPTNKTRQVSFCWQWEIWAEQRLYRIVQ